MGQIEIKHWIVFCDRCRKEERQETRGSPDLPKDWEKVKSGGWGMTNYTCTEWLCPECAEKEKAVRAKEQAKK